MRVIIVEPNKRPRIADIECSLESMQKVVGGYIEAIYLYEEPVALVCNEEAKLEGLPLNRALRDADGDVVDIIAGTFFIAGLTEDDFGSLSDEHAELFLARFERPEQFLLFGNKVVVLPL